MNSAVMGTEIVLTVNRMNILPEDYELNEYLLV